MKEVSRIELPVKGVRSLAWGGEALWDEVAGGRCFPLEGPARNSRVFYAYKFDAAIIGPDDWSIVYQRLGTKALLLRDGQLVRELDRSYDQAHLTPFPLAFAKRGSQVLVVCALAAYNRLELVDALSGDVLTRRDSKSTDFFQSRLEVSPDGHWLASAGWVWHPFEAVMLYDLQRAMVEPGHLDAFSEHAPLEQTFDLEVEGTGVTFDEANRLVFSVLSQADAGPIQHLGVYDPLRRELVSYVPSQAHAGTLMAAGPRHVVLFADCPRLVEIATGQVVRSWPELTTREPGCCISMDEAAQRDRPPLALDPRQLRFAIAGPTGITVVTLG